jgi:catechol 2,3-dioxygenase-like lactoylglutathione lyase family enzyme
MRSLLTTLLFTLLLQTGYAQKVGISFDHQAILVTDLQKASAFYQHILGLEEIEDKTQQPHIRWFDMGNGRQLHIIQTSTATPVPPKGVHMAFSTNDMEAMTQHLKDVSIPFENWMGAANTTNSRPDGIRQIYLQDPDGYWIEINGQ